MVSITGLLFAAAPALAGGVNNDPLQANCDGSELCRDVRWAGLSGRMRDQLRGMNQDRTFRDTQYITCIEVSFFLLQLDPKPSLCLYFQGTDRWWTVRETLAAAIDLYRDRGCLVCGSVAVVDAGDIREGQLTSDIVFDAGRGMANELLLAAADGETSRAAATAAAPAPDVSSA